MKTDDDEEEHLSVLTSKLSFKSNRSMWENKEKEIAEADRIRTLDRQSRHKTVSQVKAPDLLKDLIESSLGDPTRKRSDSYDGSKP